MRFITSILVFLFIASNASASDIIFKFHSPSFSGQGKSSHYLTIENIEKTRKDAIKAAEKAAEKGDGNVLGNDEEEKEETDNVKCIQICFVQIVFFYFG